MKSTKVMSKLARYLGLTATAAVLAVGPGCKKQETSPKPDEKKASLVSSEGKTSSTFDVGVLAPLTGFMSGHGGSIEMGARLAEQYLNEKGGIDGKKVRVHVLDTKSEPGATAERAKELVQRKKVKLLIGTGTSASSLAVIPIATSAGVPFIYSLDGEAKTCASGGKGIRSPYIWGSGFTERMIVKPFLKHLESLFRKNDESFRIFFIGGDYVYPRTTNSFARSVAESLGYEVVGEEYSDTATRDYTPLIRRILAARPHLLIVTNPGASGVAFMRQAKQLDLQAAVAVSGFATFDQEAIDAMGDASEGVYCVNRYSNTLDNPLNKEFVARFRRVYPGKPLLPGPTVAAGAYGALLVAAKAFEQAASTDADEFGSVMRGLEMDLPQGHVVVDRDNNIFQQPIYIMQIKKQQYGVVADLGLQKHPGFDGCSVK